MTKRPKARTSKAVPLNPLPVAFDTVDAAQLAVFVAMWQLMEQEMRGFVASKREKYALKDNDTVRADGTIVRGAE